MARIFLSHSSRDNRQAIALRQWLIEQDPHLSGEIFLDLHSNTGIRSGERWKDALRQASTRCEAVICLVSPDWMASAECRTEFRFAEYLNKRIFSARIGQLSGEDPTGDWQQIDLFGDGPTVDVDIDIDIGDGGPPVVFPSDGLYRLRDGIAVAGIGAEAFTWPPPTEHLRAPYRGWEPLEEEDAAVFFGRDAQILRGLDALRGMRRSGLEALFVVLGPSGTGKSSFLRAGLLPRLHRDDRSFLLLDTVRPQRNALTGDTGLARSLHATRARLGLSNPNLGETKRACIAGDSWRVRKWLLEAQQAAGARLLEKPEDAPAPTLILPVDQAEELFSADAGNEAPLFLELIAELAGDSPGVGSTDQAGAFGLIVLITIRTDLYQALQTAPQLARVGSVLFDELKPMPRTQFKEVITGPVARASEGGHPLQVEPALVNRLLDDCTEGADTLPLLALTLARLYEDYATDGALTLPQYLSMGGMQSVVHTEIDGVLASDGEQRDTQLRQLRNAFIPWLATVSPDSDQPMRRVARWIDLPHESRPLLEKFVARRLLVKGTRDGEVVVEVALESLLRQWNELADWLAEEREDLKAADNLERAALAWDEKDRDDAWLLEGTRLVDAEQLAAKTGFADRLEPTREFLHASRRREQSRSEAEERRRATELQSAKDRQQAAEALAAAETEAREKAQAHTAVLRKRTLVLRIVLAVTLVVAAAAVYGFVTATKARHQAEDRSRDALALTLKAQGQAMLAGVEGGGDIRALQEILASHYLMTPDSVGALFTAVVTRLDTLKIIQTTGPVEDVSFSSDRHHLISGGANDTVRVWDTDTGQPVGQPITGQASTDTNLALSGDGRHVVFCSGDTTLRVWDAVTGQPAGSPMTSRAGAITSVDLSDNGGRVVSGTDDGTVQVWNADTGQPAGPPMIERAGTVTSVAFSTDGQRVVSGSAQGTVQVWNADAGQPVGPPMNGHVGAVTTVAFSPNAQRVVSGGADHTVRVWNVGTGQPAAPAMIGHMNTVTSVAFSPDASRVVSGSYDGTIRLWHADTGQAAAQPLTGHQGSVNGAAFSPDGHRIVSGGDDATIRLWDAEIEHLPSTSSTDQTPMVTSAAVSTDRHHVVSGDRDGSLRLWDADTRQLVGTLTNGRAAAVTSVALTTDGQRIVTGSADGTLQLWDAVSRQPIGTPMNANQAAITSVTFSPDGQRIVAGGADGSLQLWNPNNRQRVGDPLKGHTGAVLAVAFSPDGHRIVSGSADTNLQLWNADTGQPIGDPMTGHTAAVTNVEFSPEGPRIVSASDDRTVRLWDAATVRPIGEPMNSHPNLMLDMTFSPDGQQLISTGIDPNRRLWPAPALTAWPNMVCTKLAQNMSYQQWHDWVSPDIGYSQLCPGLPIPPDNSGP
jgi:WD40 repeat protein